jgi:hypothetical protein
VASNADRSCPLYDGGCDRDIPSGDAV